MYEIFNNLGDFQKQMDYYHVNSYIVQGHINSHIFKRQISGDVSKSWDIRYWEKNYCGCSKTKINEKLELGNNCIVFEVLPM
jgi:hypothetical protein